MVVVVVVGRQGGDGQERRSRADNWWCGPRNGGAPEIIGVGPNTGEILEEEEASVCAFGEVRKPLL